MKTVHPPPSAPSDVLKHPDQFLVRIERPGGVRFIEATGPTLEEAAKGVGLQPSIARDACPFTREDLRVLNMASYRYGFCPVTESCDGCDRCDADWARFLSIASRIAALLPPEKK